MVDNVKVTREDRDAAADLLRDHNGGVFPTLKSLKFMRRGLDDDHPAVQAFAHHRLASIIRLSPAPEGVDARELLDRLGQAVFEYQCRMGLAEEDAGEDAGGLREEFAPIIEQALSRPPAEQVRMREAIINTPETAGFMAGVPLEAAHQRERWGSDHDSGKTAEDWIFLVGWLLGKASQALKSGDMEKAKHHTISSAAACANWHAALSGADSRMRPGIDPVERALTPPPKGQNDHG